jgi:hypothetical protein
MKEKFIVIVASYASDFQRLVNESLEKGYILHGPPEFKATSHQDSWDGRQRSWSQHHYAQCMILKEIQPTNP